MESDKILTIATWSRQSGRASLSSLLLGDTLILAVAALAGARGSPRSDVQLLCEHFVSQIPHLDDRLCIQKHSFLVTF